MSDSIKEVPKKKGYIRLLLWMFGIWVFGWVMVPYLETNIPICNEIAQVIEDRNIDSGAYMYTAGSASYESEYYLTDSFTHANRKDYGVTWAFCSGILLCFGILGFGWRYIL